MALPYSVLGSGFWIKCSLFESGSGFESGIVIAFYNVCSVMTAKCSVLLCILTIKSLITIGYSNLFSYMEGRARAHRAQREEYYRAYERSERTNRHDWSVVPPSFSQHNPQSGLARSWLKQVIYICCKVWLFVMASLSIERWQISQVCDVIAHCLEGLDDSSLWWCLGLRLWRVGVF